MSSITPDAFDASSAHSLTPATPEHFGPATRALLHDAARRAADYLHTLDARTVTATPEALARLAELDVALPEHPTDPAEVLARLDELGSSATVATAGGRYFG